MTAAGPGRPPDAAEPPEAEPETGSFVRPFIVTGGRTRPVDDRLRVETLISATTAALAAPPGFEHGRIVRICRRPASVAEVARGIGVPVGVARVLIADLVAERLLTVHDHVGLAARPPLALLERIRDGVRAL